MPARIVSLVAASVLALVSLGLVGAGVTLLWADSEKDEQGYLSTGRDGFATETYALATEDLDVGTDGVDWIVGQNRYGKIRLRADSRDGKPVFVGVAPTREVERYLDGVRHDLVTDVEYDPFRADYREVRGGPGRPAAPGGQDFWAASAAGPGTQTLTWDVESGSWSVVVMNADGSRGVDVGIKAGADVPILTPAGWGALIAGLLGLGLAAALTFVGLRSPRRELTAA